MPKVELHVHLEGTFRPATLLHLAKKNGVALPADDEAGIRRWFRFPDFQQFIEIYVTCSRCLVDPEDFKLLALDFLAEQAVQNVLWSEVHFTISTHLANGGNGDEVHAALVEAMDEGRKRWGVGMALIPDVVRNYDVDARRRDAALGGRPQGPGRGGDGDRRHGEGALERALRLALRRGARRGLHTVAHAGEHGGPESIRSALEHCRAERIDHGIRAIDDPSLVAQLAERGTPLDVCPSSNVALYAVPSLEEHPLPLLREAGVALTLNSDDPPFFGTSLTREYLLLHRTWGIQLDELAALSAGALRHAFVPEAERPELERRFREELAALGVDPVSDSSRRRDDHQRVLPSESAPDGRNGATVPVAVSSRPTSPSRGSTPRSPSTATWSGLEVAALFEARRVAFFWIGGRGQLDARRLGGRHRAQRDAPAPGVHLRAGRRRRRAGEAARSRRRAAGLRPRAGRRAGRPGLDAGASRSTSTIPTATCSSTWRCCRTGRGPTSASCRTVAGRRARSVARSEASRLEGDRCAISS